MYSWDYDELKISVVVQIYKTLRLNFLLVIYHMAIIVRYGITWCKMPFNKRIRIYVNVRNINCKNTCILSFLLYTLLLLDSIAIFMLKHICVPCVSLCIYIMYKTFYELQSIMNLNFLDLPLKITAKWREQEIVK